MSEISVVKKKRTHFAVIYNAKNKKDIAYIPFSTSKEMNSKRLAEIIIEKTCGDVVDTTLEKGGE